MLNLAFFGRQPRTICICNSYWTPNLVENLPTVSDHLTRNALQLFDDGPALDPAHGDSVD
jgi:hypothetical protein